ncbi:TPA: hypothetical protein N0F65_009430 [Lagenidium giganteum]|uniref:Uncharacterized protein n=1 Tax=Lagenidium giganteum TaxID=4803 RepID=A0AAV2ZGI1_9STRA|nr:TPA: hypothetical protein N0F65_009430 [Lagenidium giganteum]
MSARSHEEGRSHLDRDAADAHADSGRFTTPRRGSTSTSNGPGLPPARRPSSARTSLVQQKLQNALSNADKTPGELAHMHSRAGFASRSFHRREEPECDRSVSRYRNEAAVVSFTDPTTAFAYSSSVMPGIHFYTFLAAKEAKHANAPSAATNAATTTGATNMSAPPPVASVPAPAPQQSAKEDQTMVAAETAAEKPTGLRMWVPDTIVYGETGQAVWIYTDKDGHVQRMTDFSDKNILDRFSAAFPDSEPVVVCKEPIVATDKRAKQPEGAFTYQGNLLRILTAGELKTFLSNVLSARKAFAIQRFIKPNGSKAFVVRCVYEAGKPCHGWMINNVTPFQDPVVPPPSASTTPTTGGVNANEGAGSTGNSNNAAPASSSNPTSPTAPAAASTATTNATPAAVAVALVNRLCTTVQLDKACTFVKLTEKGCTAVADLNVRLVKFLEHRMHMQLQTLACDYVKDSSGRWWLLQVKAFRVKTRPNHPDRLFTLPLKMRQLFLSYRDSHVIEEGTDSEDESNDHIPGHHGQLVAARHIHKTAQCKCCLAAYPKSELSYKMTLKMINETLLRIRSRLPPEKSYSFLTAALARETPDASLAYESWSVCGYCYAIYERDQQLQRMETKFSLALGIPNSKTAAEGLSRIQDRTYVLDPMTTTTVLPPQLTLCRLMLVLNAIYDIPKDLYDAEKAHFDVLQTGTGKHKTYKAVTSRLYLRITALGYTECVKINPEDILPATTQPTRGVRRKTSTSSVAEDDTDGDGTDADGADGSLREKCYWLPLNLIRTMHFFSPRTPLQSKLKDTSGITPFLNEDNSILVQFIRATEPPLQDPSAVKRKTRSRRTALKPPGADMSEMLTEMRQPNHSILLGSTKIRMSQFRSAYVTKIDFYACMALTGELFNLKGNIGLERLRYVDSKLLTSQYRLRAYNGVYIPDDSYTTGDALSPEWMDCLRVSFHHNRRDKDGKLTKRSSLSPGKHRRATTRETSSRHMPRPTAALMHSHTSLMSENEEMDEELELMIDLANSDQQFQADEAFREQLTERRRLRPQSARPATRSSDRLEALMDRGDHGARPDGQSPVKPIATTIVELKQGLLQSPRAPTRFEVQRTTLQSKTVHLPGAHGSLSMFSPRSSSSKRLWSLIVLLNQAYSLHSRQHSFCRWECHYTLFNQKRSAIERTVGSSSALLASSSSSSSISLAASLLPNAQAGQVNFTCTHKFFLLGTAEMLSKHLHASPVVQLHLRNDMYASTRSHAKGGEYYCHLDLSKLQQTTGFDATLDIHPSNVHDHDKLTPREKAAIARGLTPYLSVSVHLSQVMVENAGEDLIASGEFMEVDKMPEGLQVLRKIS